MKSSVKIDYERHLNNQACIRIIVPREVSYSTDSDVDPTDKLVLDFLQGYQQEYPNRIFTIGTDYSIESGLLKTIVPVERGRLLLFLRNSVRLWVQENNVVFEEQKIHDFFDSIENCFYPQKAPWIKTDTIESYFEKCLPLYLRKKAIANTSKEKLSQQVESLLEAVNEAFDWGSSPEGHFFWQEEINDILKD